MKIIAKKNPFFLPEKHETKFFKRPVPKTTNVPSAKTAPHIRQLSPTFSVALAHREHTTHVSAKVNFDVKFESKAGPRWRQRGGPEARDRCADPIRPWPRAGTSPAAPRAPPAAAPRPRPPSVCLFWSRLWSSKRGAGGVERKGGGCFFGGEFVDRFLVNFLLVLWICFGVLLEVFNVWFYVFVFFELGLCVVEFFIGIGVWEVLFCGKRRDNNK